jgi:hypothetical protein
MLYSNLKSTGKAAADDLVTADKFIAFLQVTRLFWKWMLSIMFFSLQEKVASEFKASKYHCTLPLSGKSSGDHKIRYGGISFRSPLSTQGLL